MPMILIVAAIMAIIGVGGYLFANRNSESTAPVAQEVPATTVTETANTETTTTVTTETETTPVDTDTTVYKDGTYSTDTNYTVPNRAVHDVAVTMTIANDVVTAVDVTFSGDKVEASTNFQSKFVEAYETLVVGQKIDGITLSRVGGASLTTGAFNNALAAIKADASR